MIIFGIFWIDKTMREKRESEGGPGDHPIIDTHSMYISFRKYTQDIFTNTNISQRDGIYGSYGNFAQNKPEDSSFMDSEKPVKLRIE